MKFNADEIASVLQQEIEQYESQLDVREVGTVLEVGDGIARVDARLADRGRTTMKLLVTACPGSSANAFIRQEPRLTGE